MGARREFEYLAAVVRRSTFEGAVNDETEVDAWLRLLSESIGNKLIVMTVGGRVGLVPLETCMGQRVSYHGLGRSLCNPKAWS